MTTPPDPEPGDGDILTRRIWTSGPCRDLHPFPRDLFFLVFFFIFLPYLQDLTRFSIFRSAS